MKVLIVGGTRFLGYHLTSRFLQEGHKVVLLNRNIQPDSFGDRVKRIVGDRRDRRFFEKKLRSETFDIVVDMIAFGADDTQIAVNTFKGNIGHFIHISTAAVYTVLEKYPNPVKEENFEGSFIPMTEENSDWWEYGQKKRNCEKVLFKSYEQHNFPVSIFRLPPVMGERDYSLRLYTYLLRIQDGHPLILPDAGLNTYTFIYQNDFVSCIANNLLNPNSLGKAYNLAQQEIISLRNLVTKISEIMNNSVDIVDIPTDVLKKTRMQTQFSPLSFRRPLILDVSRAQKELGFSSTPFDRWMEKTVKWFTEKYKGDPPPNYAHRAKEIEFIKKYKSTISSLFENLL